MGVTAYDQKTHGPPGSKIFVKLITAILLDEQQDKERQRLEELNLRQQALKSEYVFFFFFFFLFPKRSPLATTTVAVDCRRMGRLRGLLRTLIVSNAERYR